MQVIPAVDVLNGTVVRLLGGDFRAKTQYGTGPVDAASRWMREGAAMVHVVDLEGARTGQPSRQLWRSLGEAGICFQVGGGIRSGPIAQEAVGAGASRVVVGSAVVHDEAAVDEIVEAVGTSRVVAAIDVRSGRARGSGWLDEGLEVGTAVERVVGAGIGTALVTGIDVDGGMLGPNTRILREVSDHAPGLRLIASGGVGSLEDLRSLRTDRYFAAIVGRALYEEAFSLSEAIAAAH